MKKPLRHTLTVLLAFWPGVAAALTPQELWKSVQDFDAASDTLQITVGAEDALGERIVLSDAAVAVITPDGSLAATVAEVVLTGLPDGAVEVTLAPSVRAIARTTDTAERVTEFEGVFVQTGARLVVSGPAEDLRFVIALATVEGTLAPGDVEAAEPSVGAPRELRLVAADLSGEGSFRSALPPSAGIDLSLGRLEIKSDVTGNGIGNGKQDFRLNAESLRTTLKGDFDGQLTQTLFPGGKMAAALAWGRLVLSARSPDLDDGASVDAEATEFSLNLSADLAAEVAAGEFPGGDVGFDASLGRIDVSAGELGPSKDGSVRLEQSDLRTILRATLPRELNEDNPFKMLRSGMSLFAQVTSGPGTTEVLVPASETGSSPAIVSSDTQGGRAELSFSRSGLVLDFMQKAQVFSMSGGDLPVPVDLSLTGLALRLATPALPSVRAEPYAMLVRATGLAVADSVWDAFDPDRKVPRTPLDLEVDLSGLARVSEGPDGAPAEQPIKPETIDINSLRLAFGGAVVDGSGSFRILSQTPVPSGEGKALVTFKGVYALINALSQVDDVPKDALLGLRGALAAIAKADGPDSLRSEIELRSDGTILLNGVRAPFP